MLNKVIVVVAVIVLGLLTGYYSKPIYNMVWSTGTLKDAAPDKVKKEAIGVKAGNGQGLSGENISESDAVNTVKTFPLVARLIRVSELDGTQLEFVAEQGPTDKFPVWLVEVKQRHSDKIPDTLYFQVDAATGMVLDIEKHDLKISGLSLSMTRTEAGKIQGKAESSKKKLDQTLGQNVRIDSYDGLEVVYNSKGLIIRVTATKNAYRGPKGIKTGYTKEDVIRLLGKARSAPTGQLTYSPIEDPSVLLHIRMDSEHKVTELSIENAIK